ncbi:aspartyl protease family protein [Ferruginibacter yonginensis]|uniref:Aspartyl protease family protein n=1 Tax=Ferruginibacter yonginensis TaxID=1310416 RepID=A0ABV8QRS6_9BACT
MQTIPIKSFTGGVIAIEANLGNSNQPLNFIVDTGSGGISLDSSTCVELGCSMVNTDTTVSGIAGVKKVAFVFNQKLTTGNLVTDSLNFYVNDYSLLTSIYGIKIDGIIGYSFLNKYIVQINFDSSLIRLYSQGKFNYENSGYTLHPSVNKLLAQPLTVKDKLKLTYNFFLDSGAGLNLLMTEQFAKDYNIISNKRKPVVTQAEGVGGKKSMLLTVIKTLKIGPFSFKNVPTYLYNDDQNVIRYPYAAGLLGNDLLRRFNITLNYFKKEVHIVPNTHFNDRFDYTYTGLSLYDVNGKIIIDDIVENSPASKAGLKNGDELVSVANVMNANIQEYNILFQKATDTLKLIVKRNEQLLFLALQPISIR